MIIESYRTLLAVAMNSMREKRSHAAQPELFKSQRAGISFKKLAEFLAVEALDIDISQGISQEQLLDLCEIWAVHGVILFRRQSLSPNELVNFTRLFGELVPHPVKKFSLSGYPEITILSNIKDQKGHFIGADRSGMQWHNDGSFREKPPMGTLLYGLETPKIGGNTEFSSSYASFQSIPKAEQENLKKLFGIHDYSWYWETYQPTRPPLTGSQIIPPTKHPAVVTHPVTGWHVNYLSEGVTRTIAGMEEKIGRQKVLEISNFATQKQFRYIHKWQDGDLIMWDNLAVMHRATDYDNHFRRYMLRTQIIGSKPILNSAAK